MRFNFSNGIKGCRADKVRIDSFMSEVKKELRFTKMHGAGNDYIYIDAMAGAPSNLPRLARLVSDRHFGVGSDGLVAILPSDKADFRMRMFNADGSEAQMCGNASRCIGRYVYERGLTDKREITLETLAGIKRLSLDVRDGKVEKVTVDMGEPVLSAKHIPVRSRNGEKMVSESVSVCGKEYIITAVGMGNPHAVVFCDEPTDALVLGEGPKLETADIFPEKSNIEFVHVAAPERIEMRVWERGTGETLACGTGACAVAVAAVLNGLAGRNVTIALRGGDLQVEWRESDNRVYLTGGAEFVADGIFYYTDYNDDADKR